MISFKKTRAEQPKKRGRPPKKHKVRYRPLKLKRQRPSRSEAAIKRAIELAGGREIANVRSTEAYSPVEIIAALDAAAGIKKHAALEIGCPYKSFTHYITRYPEIARALDVIRDEVKDHAERVIISELQKGHLRAAVYYTTPVASDTPVTERHATLGPPAKTSGIDWTSLPPVTRKLILDTWRSSLSTIKAASSRTNSSASTDVTSTPSFQNSVCLTAVPLIVETAASHLRALPGFADVCFTDRCAVVMDMRLAGYVFEVFQGAEGEPDGLLRLVSKDGSPISAEVLLAALARVRKSKKRNRWGLRKLR